MEKLSQGTYLGKNTFESAINGIILTSNEYPEGLHSTWHYHENSYFALIQKGGSMERRKKESIECRPGMLLFYNFEEAHRNENYLPHSKNFSVELEDRWYKKFDIDRKSLAGCFKIEDIQVKTLFTKIFRETIVNDLYSKIGIEGMVLQVFARMLRLRSNLKKPEPDWIKKLKEIIFYVEPAQLNLQYISKVVQVHPVTLSREFSRYFHCNFSHYIRALKCEKALCLMSSKHLSIEEIAWDTGFTDASHLARVFRSIYNMSPSAYRAAL